MGSGNYTIYKAIQRDYPTSSLIFGAPYRSHHHIAVYSTSGKFVVDISVVSR